MTSRKRALGGLLQGVIRITHLNRYSSASLHLVLHGDLDLDDVLIPGQHLGTVTDGTQVIDIDLVHRLDTTQDTSAVPAR